MTHLQVPPQPSGHRYSPFTTPRSVVSNGISGKPIFPPLRMAKSNIRGDRTPVNPREWKFDFPKPTSLAHNVCVCVFCPHAKKEPEAVEWKRTQTKRMNKHRRCNKLHPAQRKTPATKRKADGAETCRGEPHGLWKQHMSNWRTMLLPTVLRQLGSSL